MVVIRWTNLFTAYAIFFALATGLCLGQLILKHKNTETILKTDKQIVILSCAMLILSTVLALGLQ